MYSSWPHDRCTLVEPQPSLVDADGRLVLRHLRVGVVGEELGEDDPVGVGAADRERVADDRPLRLAPEAEDLAEVVDQAGQD